MNENQNSNVKKTQKSTVQRNDVSKKRLYKKRTSPNESPVYTAGTQETPRQKRTKQPYSPVKQNTKTVSESSKENRKTPVRIIPLGGLNEIGKNMTVFECSNDMFILDCGLAFPDSDMPGVDIVIPDFTYVERNADKIRGIVITHGHEDHIGGLSYLLKKVNVPVYATKLTIGLIEGKLREQIGRAHV